MDTDKIYAEHIANEYAPKQTSKLKAKIDGLKQLGEQILDERIEVSPVDFTPYKKSNETSKKDYQSFLYQIQQDAEKANKLETLKTVVWVGLAAVGILILYLLYKANF